MTRGGSAAACKVSVPCAHHPQQGPGAFWFLVPGYCEPTQTTQHSKTLHHAHTTHTTHTQLAMARSKYQIPIKLMTVD